MPGDAAARRDRRLYACLERRPVQEVPLCLPGFRAAIKSFSRAKKGAPWPPASAPSGLGQVFFSLLVAHQFKCRRLAKFPSGGAPSFTPPALAFPKKTNKKLRNALLEERLEAALPLQGLA